LTEGWNLEGTGVEHFGISEGSGGGGQNVHAAHGRVWIFSGITQCVVGKMGSIFFIEYFLLCPE